MRYFISEKARILFFNHLFMAVSRGSIQCVYIIFVSFILLATISLEIFISITFLRTTNKNPTRSIHAIAQIFGRMTFVSTRFTYLGFIQSFTILINLKAMINRWTRILFLNKSLFVRNFKTPQNNTILGFSSQFLSTIEFNIIQSVSNKTFEAFSWFLKVNSK